jgi:hypothetical protein
MVADINGDGLPDLVTSDEFDSFGRVDINQGGGNFNQMLVPIAGAQYLGFVVVGDFDQDGGSDIAVMDIFGPSVLTYLNRATNAVQYSDLIVPGTATHGQPMCSRRPLQPEGCTLQQLQIRSAWPRLPCPPRSIGLSRRARGSLWARPWM